MHAWGERSLGNFQLHQPLAGKACTENAEGPGGHPSKAGRVSTANFAKGQAELALLGLDAREG